VSLDRKKNASLKGGKASFQILAFMMGKEAGLIRRGTALCWETLFVKKEVLWLIICGGGKSGNRGRRNGCPENETFTPEILLEGQKTTLIFAQGKCRIPHSHISLPE